MKAPGFVILIIVNALLSFLLGSQYLYGAEVQRLPRVLNAAVLPIQWKLSQENNSELIQIKQDLDQVFFSSIQASSKFVVLNRHLTASLWETEAGRAELEKDFEAQVFVNLTVVEDQELMRLSIRLLDPNMKSLLYESAVHPRSLFLNVDKTHREKAIKELTFQLINRIPLDAYITSIQGSYLTLSKGANQNLSIGEKYKVYRPFVATTHPVLGTWNTFQLKLMGEIEIIDLKDITAIAKINNQIFPDAIEITDGIIIKGNPARQAFVLSPEEREKELAKHAILDQKTSSSLSKPSAGGEASPETGLTGGRQKLENGHELGSPYRELEEEKLNSKSPVSELEEKYARDTGSDSNDQKNVRPSQDETSEESDSYAESSSLANKKTQELLSVLGLLLNQVDVYTGIKMWQMSGSSNVRSKLNLFPLNVFGVRAQRRLMPKVFASLGGDVEFGKTQNGSYSGFNSELLLEYFGDASLWGNGQKKYTLGIIGSFSGQGINGEHLGGGDQLRGGGFARVFENFNLTGDLGNPLEAYGELSIQPLALGRLGIKGKNYTIKSSLGWGFAAGAYLPQHQPQSWQWGAELGYSTCSYTLSSQKELSSTAFTIMGMGRYRF